MYQSLLIGGAKQRFAARSTSLLQSRFASSFKLLSPTAHGLVADFQPPADFAVVELFPEQLDRSQASVLQGLEITAYSLRIPHTN